MTRFIFILICFVPLSISFGQKVVQSKEFNVRNDKFYDFFHFENGRTILFRDKGTREVLDVFNNELEPELQLDVNFDTKRKSIDAIAPNEENLNIYYTHRKEKENILSMINFNTLTLTTDTIKTLLVGDDIFLKSALKVVFSEDNSKLLFFEKSIVGVNLILVDNVEHEVVYTNIFKSELVDIYNDFKKILVTNEGKIFIVFEKNNTSYKKEKHRLYIAETTGADFILSEYDMSGTINSGIKVDYNEIRKKFIVAGLFSKGDEEDFVGYFILDAQSLGKQGIKYIMFKEELYTDLYGRNTKRDNTLQDYYITDIISRSDGGAVLIFESFREFVRRSAYTTMSRFENSGGVRGFVDFYNEDIIMVSVNNNVSEDWYRVLYKKQFSQDDGAIYSSYGLIYSPNRLHLVYNDEIKKSSTLSEYLLSPSGKYERNTILNTEYKDLQIRIRSAKQIGPSSFIVPSEVNNKLSLVKVQM